MYKWTLYSSYRGPLLGFMFLQEKKIISICVMQNSNDLHYAPAFLIWFSNTEMV